MNDLITSSIPFYEPINNFLRSKDLSSEIKFVAKDPNTKKVYGYSQKPTFDSRSQCWLPPKTPNAGVVLYLGIDQTTILKTDELYYKDSDF